MAKTLKRQRARAARLSAAVDAASIHPPQGASAPSVATPTISDELFAKLEARLLGILEVRCDTTFVDKTLLGPRQVWLVVHMDLVHAPAHEQLARVLRQALDAVATLCSLSECLRTDYNVYHAFWKRVLESNMMQREWDDDRAMEMQKVTQFTHAHGLHVELNWSHRHLLPAVTTVVRGFLDAPPFQLDVLLAGIQNSDCALEHRPLKVSLALRHCGLTRADLSRVLGMLQLAHHNGQRTSTLFSSDITIMDDDPDSYLCERGILHALRLSGNPLDATELDAVAEIFESPSSRRIDSLSLSGSMPSDAARFHSREYMAALRRVMVAAFCTKNVAHRGHGFSLSLAKNDHIQPVYIEALQYALASQDATRPLRKLCMKRALGASHGVWVRLAKILFSRAAMTTRTTVEDCELDLSEVSHADSAAQSMRVGLAELVNEAVPQVQRALVSKVPVHCRVAVNAESLATISEETGSTISEDAVRAGSLVQVLSVRTDAHGNWFMVAVPSAGGSTGSDAGGTPPPVASIWISSTNISCVRIGGRDILRSNITSLVISPVNQWGQRAALSLEEALGPDIRRLACLKCGDLTPSIAVVLRCFPLLEELNLEGTQYNSDVDPLWAKVNTSLFHTLQVLTFGRAKTIDSLTAFQDRLAQVATPVLRHLNLVSANFGADGLRIVSDILQENRSIQQVELPRTHCVGWDDFDEPLHCDEYNAMRLQIDKQLRAERMPLPARLAFLSVPHFQGLEKGVVAEIFRFTGTARTVMWWG